MDCYEKSIDFLFFSQVTIIRFYSLVSAPPGVPLYIGLAVVGALQLLLVDCFDDFRSWVSDVRDSSTWNCWRLKTIEEENRMSLQQWKSHSPERSLARCQQTSDSISARWRKPPHRQYLAASFLGHGPAANSHAQFTRREDESRWGVRGTDKRWAGQFFSNEAS